ncbi:hypothetical protein VTL71DRAFT_6596 [Oculimacula yallundae]|uniref:Glutathione S-transferase n=1 Tax=Oculimacula yallundae TaxID=86028 RepID=A0ABR4BXJ2_9HELO
MTYQPYDNDTPADVKNAKGLHLITENTPNGQKVQILLEELAAVYSTEWTTTIIDTATNVQKRDWFLRLNPNGRIPVLIDNTTTPPHPVMETSAELLYLLKHDTEHHFSFSDPLLQSEVLQWLFFWHGSGAPYQGNLGYFRRAEEKSDFAIQRFRTETLRVYGVLEIQLSGKYTGQPKEYLVGTGKGKYTVADIGTWGWVKGYARVGFTEEDMKTFPCLVEWIERIAGREAVKRGVGEKYT